MRIGIAVLAAGASTRMGRAKQLLPWGGVPLVRHVCRVALASGLGPVAVVLGAAAERIATALRDERVEVVANPVHAAGQGTSVWAATRWAGDRDCAGLLLMLGDQPFVGAPDLGALAARLVGDGAGMAAAQYADGPGVPALFTRASYPDLLALGADQGAKALLRRRPGSVAVVPMPHALMDLDTPEAYAAASAVLGQHHQETV